MDNGAGKHLLVVLNAAIALLLLQAVIGTDLFGGVDACPIQSKQVMAAQPGHLFKGLAALGLKKDAAERTPQIAG